MSRRISFKIYSKDAAGNPINEEGLALAFQRHCQQNLGVNDDLNLLAKKVFMKFLMDSVDRSKSDKHDLSAAGVTETGVPNGTGEAVTEGDIGTAAVASDSIAGIDVVNTPTVSGETAPA